MSIMRPLRTDPERTLELKFRSPVPKLSDSVKKRRLSLQPLEVRGKVESESISLSVCVLQGNHWQTSPRRPFTPKPSPQALN